MSGFEVKILFASFLFYAFLGFLLSIGGSAYILTSVNIQQPSLITQTGNPIWDFLTGTYSTLSNFIGVVSVILINPFTAIGFLSWFSIALMSINIYTIARLVRGGG